MNSSLQLSVKAFLRKFRFFRMLRHLISSTHRCLSHWMGKVLFVFTQSNHVEIYTTKVSNSLEIKYAVSSKRSKQRAKNEFKWEPETLDFLSQGRYRLREIPSPLFFDIGANVGTFSIYAAKIGYEVIAFEPSFVNSFAFSMNIKINSVASRVTNLKVAISDHNSLDTLIHSKELEAGNSGAVIDDAYMDGQMALGGGFYQERVPVVSLDSLCSSLNLRPNLVKIDTDGNELFVLRGAKKILAKKSLVGCLVEVSSEETKYLVLRQLNELGFKLFHDVSKSESVFNHNLVFFK